MDAAGPSRAAWILIVALSSGAVSLILELSAVRLLAPWFGATSAVWTHVIGVILLALSCGYLLGARLSRGPRLLRSLGIVLWLAAASVAWLPALARPAAGALVPEGLALDQAAGVLRWGSLAAALMLFAPPSLLLGCVAPLASEVLQRRSGCTAGEAGGRVLGVSTLGSLLGSFATTYWLVPELGLTRTYLACACALGVLALTVGLLARRWGIESAAGLIVAAALLGSRWERPSPGAGCALLEQRESPYQSVRVVERQDGEVRLRFLQVNEAFDSFQSVWQPEPGLLPEGYYYNALALPAAWDARTQGRWNLLVLGLGAGSVWRVLQGTLPPELRLEGLGVEIDPVVVDCARTWMGLTESPDRRVVSGLDARAVLSMAGRFDQIVIDAYANQIEIPAQLSSREFFAEAGEHLEPGGWISANVGAFGLQDPVVEALAATAAAGLHSRVLALRVPFSRNVVLIARPSGVLPEPGSAEFLAITPARLARLGSQASLPGMWRWFEPRMEPVATDDRNPIERLQQASIELAERRTRETR